MAIDTCALNPDLQIDSLTNKMDSTSRRQARQALVNELWQRDDPQVMIVRYDDELERIGTQAETLTYHTNPIQAVDAFLRLLVYGSARRSHHYAFLFNGQYLIRWLNAHSNSQNPPSPKDLVDEVMSDLTENHTVYNKIIHITIISYLEYHARGRGTPAPRLEAATNSPDVDDLMPFDLYTPPFWVHGRAPGECTWPSDEVQAQFLPSETEPGGPLLAEPIPGSVPLPPANNAPPQEIRDMSLSLEARRVFACNFPGCSSRLTRPSDLRRHMQNVHRGHTQQ